MRARPLADLLLSTPAPRPAASLLTTLVCTSRFLVSYFPPLEREVESRRWHVPWVAVTLFDPLLQPVRRGFFGQKEEGDLVGAAQFAPACSCANRCSCRLSSSFLQQLDSQQFVAVCCKPILTLPCPAPSRPLRRTTPPWRCWPSSAPCSSAWWARTACSTTPSRISPSCRRCRCFLAVCCTAGLCSCGCG